jgi:hypothetical protein
VIGHSNQYSFLKTVHEEAKRNIDRVNNLKNIYLPLKYYMVSWQIEVIIWFNRFIMEDDIRHLWLFGPHLTGKTNFLSYFLKIILINVNQCFIISDDPNYHFGHYIPGYHLISINDSFNPDDYKMNLIKRAINREYFNQNIKYEKTKMIKISIPFIFVSEKMPVSIKDISSFINKLKIIEIKN